MVYRPQACDHTDQWLSWLLRMPEACAAPQGDAKRQSGGGCLQGFPQEGARVRDRRSAFGRWRPKGSTACGESSVAACGEAPSILVFKGTHNPDTGIRIARNPLPTHFTSFAPAPGFGLMFFSALLPAPKLACAPPMPCRVEDMNAALIFRSASRPKDWPASPAPR